MPVTAKKKPKVGDKASVTLGGTVWRVRIVEDRGLLGVGGRRIFRVKPLSKDGDPEQTFEVPAEYLTAVR